MKTMFESSGLAKCSRRAALRKVLLGMIATAAAPLAAGAKPTHSRSYWGDGVRPDVHEYVRNRYDYAVTLLEKYSIPIWGTFGIGIHESATGTSDLAIGANNHFGIKALEDWNGPVYCKETGRGPGNGVECAYYRAYASVEKGFYDFGEFLQHPRYHALRHFGPRDFIPWLQALKDCGFSEDPDYVEKVWKPIEDHRLYELNYLRPRPVHRA